MAARKKRGGPVWPSPHCQTSNLDFAFEIESVMLEMVVLMPPFFAVPYVQDSARFGHHRHFMPAAPDIIIGMVERKGAWIVELHSLSFVDFFAVQPSAAHPLKFWALVYKTATRKAVCVEGIKIPVITLVIAD